MIIGIDIRALQTGHRFRGIGEVTKQVTNRILPLIKKNNHKVIFYKYDSDKLEDLLDIPKELQYDVIKLGLQPEHLINASKRSKLKRNLRELYGNPINDSGRSDVFLQFDYMFGVPKNTKTVLIGYDLIPYIFWRDFFSSPWIPFKNRALRKFLRTIYANYKYTRTLKRRMKSSSRIIAISNNTKQDLQKRLNISKDKVKVVHLGVDTTPTKTINTDTVKEFPSKPYLIFVGAGDERRRVDDLIAAYNNLKASGVDIQLALVGDNFNNNKKIPNDRTRKAVKLSSYRKDILMFGYVDDITKQKLISGAIAFVYPTKYEGFGLPVLEAMLLSCPVITYKNSSIPEAGGDFVLYAKDWYDIAKKTEEIMKLPKTQKDKMLNRAKRHAQKFTWDKTVANIYKELEDQRN